MDYPKYQYSMFDENKGQSVFRTDNEEEFEAIKKKWNAAPVKPSGMKQYDDQIIKQDGCTHEHKTLKQATGHNKPENKGRYFVSCLDCKKWIGWQDEGATI